MAAAEAAEHMVTLWQEGVLERIGALCPICMETASQPCLVLCCGAVYCTPCLRTWHKVATTCPTCKASIQTAVTGINVPPVLYTVVDLATGAHRSSLEPYGWRRCVYTFHATTVPALPRRRLPAGVLCHPTARKLRLWVWRDVQAITAGEGADIVYSVVEAALEKHGSQAAMRNGALLDVLPGSTAQTLVVELEQFVASGTERAEHDALLRQRHVWRCSDPDVAWLKTAPSAHGASISPDALRRSQVAGGAQGCPIQSPTAPGHCASPAPAAPADQSPSK